MSDAAGQELFYSEMKKHLITLEEKYLHDAEGLKSPVGPHEGRVDWQCPSNIALIKYWGKKSFQKPINPSLSFTLMNSVTVLSVEYRIKKGASKISLDFILNNHPYSLFTDRLLKYLLLISNFLPFLNTLHLKINSYNTFPHSAGIASSASSFGALGLALCNIEQKLFGTLTDEREFLNKSSFLARLGSGSAARSVYGGCALWGHTQEVAESTDEAAISLMEQVKPVFADYHDSILVVSSAEKTVSSSAGHKLMENNPFAHARVWQANSNLKLLLRALKTGNLEQFNEVIEQEALALHSLMMSSFPGFILLRPGTLEIIEQIRKFRKKTGLLVGFTLDAGANVHLLYPARYREYILIFIEESLKRFCENGYVIHDQVGSGPLRKSQR